MDRALPLTLSLFTKVVLVVVVVLGLLCLRQTATERARADDGTGPCILFYREPHLFRHLPSTSLYHHHHHHIPSISILPLAIRHRPLVARPPRSLALHLLVTWHFSPRTLAEPSLRCAGQQSQQTSPCLPLPPPSHYSLWTIGLFFSVKDRPPFLDFCMTASPPPCCYGPVRRAGPQ